MPSDAVTVTPTDSMTKSSPTPLPKSTKDTPPSSADIINELKEKIASKVAQLKLVTRKGTIGTVTDVSNAQITLEDLQNKKRIIDVDELTKFSSPSAKESFGISDITKGTKLGILGLFNKQSQRILARFVEVATVPVVLHGAVDSIDKENFTLEVMGMDGKMYSIEVENTTKTRSYTKDTDLVRSGFSKIKEEENIIVFGFPTKTNKQTITASRILLLPELPPDPKIVLPPKTERPKATPTLEVSPTLPTQKKPTVTPTGN